MSKRRVRDSEPLDDVYAPPRPLREVDESAWEVWREGILLVVPRGGQLPKRCVRCNRKTKRRITLVLKKTPSWVGLFWLLSPPLMLLLRLVGMQRGQLTLGLCDDHHRDWQLNRVFTTALIFAIFVGIFGLSFGEGSVLLTSFVIVIGIGWVLTLRGAHLLRLEKLDADYLWVVPSQNFLDGFEDELDYADDEDEDEWDDESDA